MKVSYTTSEKVIAEFALKHKQQDWFDEDLAYIYADTAIDKILTMDANKVFVAHKVLNHQGKVDLGHNFKQPLSIAYRGASPTDTKGAERMKVSQMIKRNFEEGYEVEINIINTDNCINCDSSRETIEIDPSEVIMASNPEYMVEYNRFLMGYTSHYQSNINSEFKIIRPTTNYFFNLPTRIQGCQVPNLDHLTEYSIENKILEVNSGTAGGEVIVSYIGSRVDEKGFLMIPNEPFVFEAIEADLLAAFALRAYSLKQTQGTRAFWNDMDMRARRLLTRAKSKIRIPDTDDWEEILRTVWLNRIPNKTQHNTHGKYFGNLYRPGNESLGYSYNNSIIDSYR